MNIVYVESGRLFKLDTANTSYVFRVGKDDRLHHLYWGAKVDRTDDVAGLPGDASCQEYPCWGEYFFDEPALKVTFHDGTRDVRAEYRSHRIEKTAAGMSLSVSLKDTGYPLSIELVYTLYEHSDIVDRHSVLRNEGDRPMMLESAQSAVWNLPLRKQFRLTHLSGRWGKEYQIEHIALTQAKTVLETKRGVSGPDANPVFFLDEDGTVDEEHGRVWFGGVQWSGNFKIAVMKNRSGRVSVTGGINDFDFSWPLNPGEAFTTPVFSGGYTDGGFGDASRILHDYQTDCMLTPYKANMVQPVLYNAFGSFHEDIDEERMLKLVDPVAEIGVELFVIDAGWHGLYDMDFRNTLGDWQPHRVRFPNGLKPLIDKVNASGMEFGIWMEPEVVNPNSNLFKQHPEWIFRFRNRESSYVDLRYVLNLARPEVKEFVYNSIHTLLAENNIKYFKIDFNRYITEIGWPEIDVAEQKSVLTRYVHNFYEIFGRLNQEFPHVIFENCASGGGRVDLAMSRYFTRINRSDNQDPLDELKLHEGFSYAYLPRMAGGGCHISPFTACVNRRTTPLRYQAHVGMLGWLAIGENMHECSPEKLEEIRQYVAIYKEIRKVVHFGQIHRLVSPRENPYAAFEYVSRDRKKAVLFVLGQSMQFRDAIPAIRLRGLDPDVVYEVEGVGNISGRGLMELGIQCRIVGDFDSRLIRITAL